MQTTANGLRDDLPSSSLSSSASLSPSSAGSSFPASVIMSSLPVLRKSIIFSSIMLLQSQLLDNIYGYQISALSRASLSLFLILSHSFFSFSLSLSSYMLFLSSSLLSRFLSFSLFLLQSHSHFLSFSLSLTCLLFSPILSHSHSLSSVAIILFILCAIDLLFRTTVAIFLCNHRRINGSAVARKPRTSLQRCTNFVLRPISYCYANEITIFRTVESQNCSKNRISQFW